MSGTYSASEYKIQEAVLTIPERGIELDIGSTILELIIYESVNTPYITGRMVCVDTDYVFERLKFDGTERIKIDIASDYDTFLLLELWVKLNLMKTHMHITFILQKIYSF